MKETLVLSREACRQIYETYDESFPFMCVSSKGCVRFNVPDGCTLAVVDTTHSQSGWVQMVEEVEL